MFCPNCGEKIEDNSRFCKFCGTKVDNIQKAEVKQDEKPNAQAYVVSEKKDDGMGVAKGCLISAVAVVVTMVVIVGIAIAFFSNEVDYETPLEMSEEDYKAACSEYSYEDLLRNPDTLNGEKAVFKGEVMQVMEDSFLGVTYIGYRIDLATDALFDTEDIVAYYTLQEGESRILVGDMVTVWGELTGIETFTLERGGEVSVPTLDVRYIKLED